MTRGLSWSDVRAVLDEFGTFRYETGPLGFTVHVRFNTRDSWRVRCGSGIAGRGGQWRLVRVHSGEALSPAISTRSGLRRVLREHLAGEHPDPQHRDWYYATKHATRFQSGHYIWKLKRARTHAERDP